MALTEQAPMDEQPEAGVRKPLGIGMLGVGETVVFIFGNADERMFGLDGVEVGGFGRFGGGGEVWQRKGGNKKGWQTPIKEEYTFCRFARRPLTPSQWLPKPTTR